MTRQAMDICLRVLKESNKITFDSYSVRNSILIISHITFRDCRAHIFSDNLSQNSCILSVSAPYRPITSGRSRPSDRGVGHGYPEPKIRGGGGGGCLKKTFFGPLRPQFRKKIRGCQGLSPGSATDSFMSNTVSLTADNHKWYARSNNCSGSLMLREFLRGA